MILSQSYTQCIYIGRKAGLEPDGFCQFKAMQMLADIDGTVIRASCWFLALTAAVYRE